MSKFLGIDYGEKRIGVAVSDESGRVAFPADVLPNDKEFFGKIEKIVEDESISAIVLGESHDYKGRPNVIMKKIEELKKKLESDGATVYLEPEFMTSEQARRHVGAQEMTDASAAAIILQSFLDKKNMS